ncbi:F-box only protein 6-like isoform X3 [Chenopodium quinoa]|uniref:F-box only protein 6-like isoform X3 n=1 Tax=Chenopodium quinoa TaxID=63459 RepID=UPI000B781745|nr:F-box only protein 6-like isoform X3 [Chenopodium quinoa]
MEQELAMLRQLLSHFHELSQLYGYNTTSFHPHPLLHSYSYSSSSSPSCFLNLDDNLVEENCNSVIMPAEKPGSLKMVDHYKPPPTKRSRKERNRGKHSGSSNSSENMSQELWKEFPEDLLEAVIARLPIATFFRFRSVCRKWNGMLTSRSFTEHCAQVSLSQPWFYTITHENVNTGAIYDPSAKKWRHPTIPPLPPKVILLPVASVGGLVCFLDIGHRLFYICNPLTQVWKELPPRSVKVWSRVAVGMIQYGNSTTHGYKILWFGRDGEYEIYDSLKNTWARPGNLPSGIKLPLSLNFRSNTVSVDATIYFMRSEPDGIVSCDMVSGIWKQHLIPTPPNSTDHNLAECGGRIFLVGLLTKNAATCVCVWELQKMTLLWKEVDRMPNVWCLEFYGKHVRMTCLGNKSLLMLSLRSRQMNRIVTYDVAKREWLKVPGCVLPRGRKRQWIACGTAFNPCLTAVP